MRIISKSILSAIILNMTANSFVHAQTSADTTITKNKNLVNFIKDKFFSNKKDTTKKPFFMPLPILSYAPETKVEAGIMGLYSFYTDKEYPNIRNSSISLQGSYTQKKQTKLKAKGDVWTKKNAYHLMGEINYSNFPAYFYGIGSHTIAKDKELLNQKLLRITANAEKQFLPHYYGGVRVGVADYQYRSLEGKGIYENNLPYGSSGGRYAYVGISQMFDNRNTNTYTTSGQMIRLTADWAPNLFVKENYKGGIINFDYRFFHPLSENLTIAINGKTQNYTSSKVPFYLYSQLGGDEMMRGYYQGRYRDRNMMAGQAELRYRIIPRFGVVLFGGTGAVYGDDKLQITNFKPNYGGGLRYFFDLQRNMSVRIDYGVGERHSGEARQSGWYFSLGEAF